MEKLRLAGQDVSYPLVTYTVLENFVPLMTADLDVSVPNGWGWMGVSGAVSEMKPVQDAHIRFYQYCNEAPSYYMWRILDQGREPLRAVVAT